MHVHTDDPGAALHLGTAAGTIDGVEIANMHRQTLEREERLSEALEGLPTLETGVVVVAPGEGNRRLFESLGATRVIEGGQTMNPSTEEIVAAVDATPATEVIVLPEQLERDPHRGAGGRAREQAARASCRRGRVQAGLAAMVVYDAERPAAENEPAMVERDRGRRHGRGHRSPPATSSSTASTCARARGSASPTATAVASGESFDDVAGAVAERLLDGGRELLTLLTGADEPPLDAARRRARRRHPGIEIEIHAGGQPHYPLLLSAE